MAKILVVDDEAAITTQLEERLTRLGFEVAGCASSGEEAVKMAERIHPDLILMDIVMPGKWDGIESAARIQQTMDIPIIFLTAYGDDRFVKRAKRIGPFGYIIKPFQESELRANVELALYNQRMREKLSASERKWRSLAENLDEAVILSDTEGRIFFWNRGAENIFGYRASEMRGKPVTGILSESFREKFRNMIDGIMQAPGPDIPLKKTETVGLRKDWSKFPLEISFKFWNIKNEKYMICLVRDITDLKKKEDGIKTSLKEMEMQYQDIKDRVKDNLNVIYHLLKLQHEYIQDEKRDAASRRREEISFMENAGKIDFGKYLRNLGKRLFQAYNADSKRIGLTVDAEGIFLDIQSAVYCGLIAGEIISNSLKYGFPENQPGRISFNIKEKEGNQFMFSAKSNGIGFIPDSRTPARMDTQIIRNLAAQLGGELKLEKNEGIEFEIVF
jgi:PAS domain S-box-containing protein